MNSSRHSRCFWPADPVWVGDSAPLQRVKGQLREAADTRLAVLLIGEMGTGRRLGARTLHQLSTCGGGPFVHHPCAATHPARVDCELFGSRAVGPEQTQEAGRYEQAAGGTLFLEDVDTLPNSAQSHLLDVMRDGPPRNPGSAASVEQDVRWVASSSRDLGQLSRAGTFCAELFYRLSIVSIQLPPLRERRDDIPPLTYHFIDQCAASMGQFGIFLSPPAMQALLDHSWPGNVWELKRILERAVVLANGGRILLEHIHFPLCALPRDPRPGAGPGNALIGIVPPGASPRPELN